MHKNTKTAKKHKKTCFIKNIRKHLYICDINEIESHEYTQAMSCSFYTSCSASQNITVCHYSSREVRQNIWG